MIFYSSLFYFLIIINKNLGILEINFNTRNECSVRIETENGVETCFNQQCSDYKDPWRIINSHIQDKPCYLHYLKLSFTTYDQLLVFIELQRSSQNTLETFFADNDSKLCMLEIKIENIYPFNKNYFLSEDMLNKLGGENGKIDILQIEIEYWYNSSRSVVQIIENNIVDKQPFQQITVFYPCRSRGTIERLVLAKYLEYQERSSCPTQIKIISQEDLPVSDDDSSTPNPDYNDYLKKPNITFNSFNKPKKSNLFATIAIILIISVLIIGFAIYQFLYSSARSNKT